MQDPSFGSELCRIARDAIFAHVTRGERARRFDRPAPRAGVFVTLRSSGGGLRGCVGSIEPIENDVRSETARSAVLAATRDPRFPPVAVDEVEILRIEVSMLLPEEPIHGVNELDPSSYGVIVRHVSGRRGLLLPAIPGIHDAKQQLSVVLEKARISVTESYALSRFRVEKWQESR